MLLCEIYFHKSNVNDSSQHKLFLFFIFLMYLVFISPSKLQVSQRKMYSQHVGNG